MTAKIVNNKKMIVVVGFSYILFALSLATLWLNKPLAIMVLAASFGTFLLGRVLHILSENDSPKTIKKKKGEV